MVSRGVDRNVAVLTRHGVITAANWFFFFFCLTTLLKYTETQFSLMSPPVLVNFMLNCQDN